MKHTHWVYAFRFLKASLYLDSTNPAEAPAVENLRAITSLAGQRGDHAVIVAASLLEGLSLLKTMKEDSVVRIQGCLAQVQKYQFDESIQIPQLDILTRMLDLACSFQQKNPDTIANKFRELQKRLDEYDNNDWDTTDTELLLPITKQAGGPRVISDDTSSILRPGFEHETSDYLALSFCSKYEAFILT